MKTANMTKHLSLVLIAACLLTLGAPLLDKLNDAVIENALPVSGGHAVNPGSMGPVVSLFTANGSTTLNPAALFARHLALEPMNQLMSQRETLSFNQNVHVLGTDVCFTGYGKSTTTGSPIVSAFRSVCLGGPDQAVSFNLKVDFAEGTAVSLSAGADSEIQMTEISTLVQSAVASDGEQQSAALSASVPAWTNQTCSNADMDPIDVLVLYTPDAVPTSGQGSLIAAMASSIEDTNQVLCNSGINARLRVTGMEGTPLSSQDAVFLRGQTINVLGGSSSNYIPGNLNSLREKARADLIILFANTTDCGASEQFEDSYTGAVLNRNRAAAVVSVEPNNCLSGLFGASSKHRLAHEISHLLGLDHAKLALAETPQANTAATTYAHGYVNQITQGGPRWGTVETDPGNHTIIPMFSKSGGTPACPGCVVGDSAQADSVAALQVNIETVRSYYPNGYAQEYLVLNPLLYRVACPAPNENGCWGGVPLPAFSTISAAVYHSICKIKNDQDAVDPTMGPDPLAQFPWSWPSCNTKQGDLQIPPSGTPTPVPDLRPINDPAEEDLILVGPGTYIEHIGIGASSLTLKSILGPQFTSIRGTQDGQLPEDDASNPVYAFNLLQPTPAQIRVVQNRWGAGAAVAFSGFRYANIDNETSPVIHRPTLDGFTIKDGFGSRAAGGVWCMGQAFASVKNNVITNNTSWSGLGAAITFEGCGGEISGNIITGNRIEQPAAKLCGTEPGYNREHCSTTGCIDPAFRTADHMSLCYPWIQAGNLFCQSGYPHCYNTYLDNDGTTTRTMPLDLVQAPAANTITGGAAIFVSPICRSFNYDSGDISRYWGFDEERNDTGPYQALCKRNVAASATLKIFNNLIYDNSYKNQLAVSPVPTPPASGKRGAAIYLAAPTTPFSSMNLNPNPFKVKLYHNTVSGNSFIDTIGNMTGAQGAALGCLNASGTWDGSNALLYNILAGNPSTTDLGSNHLCTTFNSTDNVIATDVDGTDLLLGEIFMAGSGSKDPYLAERSDFYYRPSYNGSNCDILNHKLHVSVDKAGCIEPDTYYLDLTGIPRHEDTYVTEYTLSGCNSSASPDMGALERLFNTRACGGDKILEVRRPMMSGPE